ncbi:MAG: pyrroloquinoline quinone-dependent dehydrogenase [Hyphomicrobiaceae bacterium]
MKPSIIFKIFVTITFTSMSSGLAMAGTVDDARLKSASKDKLNWMSYGRDYTNQRFSPLKQINTETIKRLVPKWIYQTGTSSTFQTVPIVEDGVMYVTSPFSHVAAVDARTGQELWNYHHKRKTKKMCCGPANQGVAIAYGKVYVATVDARLIALDRKSGEVLWDQSLVQQDTGPTEEKDQLGDATSFSDQKVSGSTGIGARVAPLVYEGQVIVGITGVGYGLHLEEDRPGAPLSAVIGIAGSYGRPGFIAAFDAKTGNKTWQFDTTKKGWEGDYVTETAYGVKLNRDVEAEKAAAAKNLDAWKFGGGSVWSTPAVDPKLGLIYFGIGNPSPQAAGDSRPGDNLYTMSLVALDAKTGKLAWYFQQLPHDVWGYDVASPPTLFDVKIDGETVPAVGQASKLGWYFVNDRRTGKLLFKSEAFVPQENMFAVPSEDKPVRIAPGAGGGSNWSPTSVDEARGRVYVAGLHMPFIYKKEIIPATKDKPPLTYYSIEPAKEANWGLLSAIDLNNNGKIVWQHKTEQILIGGVLATAGGVVFTGQGSGEFSAFDAKSGKKIWKFMAGAGVNAPPMSYKLDGKQYVAVAAGGSRIWGFRQGGAVIVFGLMEE